MALFAYELGNDPLKKPSKARPGAGAELSTMLAVNLKTRGSTMTYVASPSHPVGALARIEDLKQCLDTARKHLNATSKSSDAEKRAELIASAVDAGWEEGEVRSAIAGATNDRTDGDVFLTPTLGLVPSSSM